MQDSTPKTTTNTPNTKNSDHSRMKLPVWKKYLPKIIWGVVILIFAGCLLRVAIWEYFYYRDMEGTERAVATTGIVSQPLEVDETEPTETEVAEYIVAADKPRYLTIPKLGITNARILEVGLSANGQMLTPYNIFDVGWYNGSAKPGTRGTAIIDGHNGGPNVQGVFKNLPSLGIGDLITVEMGDGTKYNYRVNDNTTVALAEADAKMLYAAQSPIPGKESITLITCTGEWSQVKQTYLSRQFVRAVRLD